MESLNEKELAKAIAKSDIPMEKDQAEILTNPRLFEIINKEMDKKIVREEDTRKVIFLCSAGRLVKNCNLASYNLLINSESGSGKDHVTDNTLKIWPKTEEPIVIKKSRITETVFTYWKPVETWDGVVFYNEDVSNSILNSDVFKVMASSGSNATVVINQKAVEIEIEGKPVIMVTAATARPNKEVTRRFTIVNLDEGLDQTKEIMKVHARMAANGLVPEYEKNIVKSLAYLRRVKVIVPYAEKLTDYFPIEHVFMRTHFPRFLDYIKASAALHQYQREEVFLPGEMEPMIEANGIDYEIAREVLKKVTTNQQMIPLTKNQQRIIDIMKGFGDEWVSVGDLEPKVSFMGDRHLRRELDRLVEDGLLFKDKEKREADKPVLVYRYKDIVNIEIPEWKVIENDKK